MASARKPPKAPPPSSGTAEPTVAIGLPEVARTVAAGQAEVPRTVAGNVADRRTPSASREAIPLYAPVEVGQRLPLAGRTLLVESVISRSGVTGQAAIFRVRDEAGEGLVLKLYTHEPDPKRWPYREALTALVNLDHPNIMRLHAFGIAHDGFQGRYTYELCDCLEGGTLRDAAAKREETGWLREVVVPQLVAAVEGLQSVNLVHCDIKPENVMFTDSTREHLVLVDIGSLKSLDAQKDSAQTTTLFATKLLASPELRDGRLSRKADPYGIGVTILSLFRPDLFERPGWDDFRDRQLAKKPVIDLGASLGATMRPFSDLINGLTVGDHALRWGIPELRQWLNDRPVEVRYQALDESLKPIKTQGRVISSVSELLAFLDDPVLPWTPWVLQGEPLPASLPPWIGQLYDDDLSAQTGRVLSRVKTDMNGVSNDRLREVIARVFQPDRLVSISKKPCNIDGEHLRESFAAVVAASDDHWVVMRGVDVRGEGLGGLGDPWFSFELSARRFAATEGPGREEARGLCGVVDTRLAHQPERVEDYAAAWYKQLTGERLLSLAWHFDPSRGLRPINNERLRTPEDVSRWLWQHGGELQKYAHLVKEVEAFLDQHKVRVQVNPADLLPVHSQLWRIGAKTLLADGVKVTTVKELTDAGVESAKSAMAAGYLLPWLEHAVKAERATIDAVRESWSKHASTLGGGAVLWALGVTGLGFQRTLFREKGSIERRAQRVVVASVEELLALDLEPEDAAGLVGSVGAWLRYALRDGGLAQAVDDALRAKETRHLGHAVLWALGDRRLKSPASGQAIAREVGDLEAWREAWVDAAVEDGTLPLWLGSVHQWGQLKVKAYCSGRARSALSTVHAGATEGLRAFGALQGGMGQLAGAAPVVARWRGLADLHCLDGEGAPKPSAVRAYREAGFNADLQTVASAARLSAVSAVAASRAQIAEIAKRDESRRKSELSGMEGQRDRGIRESKLAVDKAEKEHESARSSLNYHSADPIGHLIVLGVGAIITASSWFPDTCSDTNWAPTEEFWGILLFRGITGFAFVSGLSAMPANTLEKASAHLKASARVDACRAALERAQRSLASELESWGPQVDAVRARVEREARAMAAALRIAEAAVTAEDYARVAAIEACERSVRAALRGASDDADGAIAELRRAENARAAAIKQMAAPALVPSDRAALAPAPRTADSFVPEQIAPSPVWPAFALGGLIVVGLVLVLGAMWRDSQPRDHSPPQVASAGRAPTTPPPTTEAQRISAQIDAAERLLSNGDAATAVLRGLALLQAPHLGDVAGARERVVALLDRAPREVPITASWTSAGRTRPCGSVTSDDGAWGPVSLPATFQLTPGDHLVVVRCGDVQVPLTLSVARTSLPHVSLPAFDLTNAVRQAAQPTRGHSTTGRGDEMDSRDGHTSSRTTRDAGSRGDRDAPDASRSTSAPDAGSPPGFGRIRPVSPTGSTPDAGSRPSRPERTPDETAPDAGRGLRRIRPVTGSE